MNETAHRLIARHNWVAKKVRYYCFGSTCEKLRDQAIRIVTKAEKKIEEESRRLADSKMETESNMAFTLATMLKSTSGILKTWRSFHEQRFSDSWHHLMDAQDATRAALSFSGQSNELENQLRLLIQMERWMFPWQAFFSPSLVIIEERCSICNLIIDECVHLPGKLYMGQPCKGIVTRFFATGVSLVEQPADKRCFARNFPAHSGKSRDNFTGRLLKDTEKHKLSTAILLISTYMRDFVITDEVLAASFGNSCHQQRG